MNILDQYQTDRLKASDIPVGREFTVILERVVLEKLDDDEPEKPVCHFSNAKKSLPLNKTNALQIAEAYGPETTAWHGRPIILYRAKTMFGGKMVDCIRCRVPAQSEQPQQRTPNQQTKNPPSDNASPMQPAGPDPDQVDDIPF